jgi:arsenate reductase (thioredoxin)
MDDQKLQTILFLSTGNSIRSVFAEHLVNAGKFNDGRFKAYSAGSRPAGFVHPIAKKVLQDVYGIDAGDARSKSWDEFRNTHFDMIITLCDKEMESCPLFPGQPRIASWNTANPEEAAENDEQKLVRFKHVAQEIQARIQLLRALPPEKLSHLEAQAAG